MPDEKNGPSQTDDFTLGAPALVCRWRLANRTLPLENRHLRALSRRRVSGVPVSAQLVAWAKQHIEWTLGGGAARHPDGVLMVVVDECGHAAMTVGPYEPLPATGALDLAERARQAALEAATSGVAPEALWVVRGDSLVCGSSADLPASGTASLVRDLARTLGIGVSLLPWETGRPPSTRRSSSPTSTASSPRLTRRGRGRSDSPRPTPACSPPPVGGSRAPRGSRTRSVAGGPPGDGPT